MLCVVNTAGVCVWGGGGDRGGGALLVNHLVSNLSQCRSWPTPTPARRPICGPGPTILGRLK